MRSKTSFFDIRFSRHLLRRFWPLFALWLALLLLVGPLALNVSCYQEPARYVTELRGELLSSARGAVWLSALMGALMAMGMLSYLYFPRDCGLVNSLPLKRETVYFTAVLTGLVPMLLTDVLVFALLWGFYGAGGAGAPSAPETGDRLSVAVRFESWPLEEAPGPGVRFVFGGPRGTYICKAVTAGPTGWTLRCTRNMLGEQV